MSATRRLDVLAVIGGFLALAAIVGAVCYMSLISHFNNSYLDISEIQKEFLERMPESDVRADLEILAPWDLSAKPQAEKLKEAIKKYPDSARLHFRLGALEDQPLSPHALKWAAELDPDNALPLYLLASAAAEKGDMNQALDLITQGNRREKVYSYPMPYEPCKSNGLMELAVPSLINNLIDFRSFSHIKKVAIGIADYADELHSAGRTDEALAVLNQVRKIGWKIIRAEHAMTFNVMCGGSLVKICQKYEKQIYTEIGSKAGLAGIEKEKIKLRYLIAGSRAYDDNLRSEPPRRLAVFMATSIPLLPAWGGIWYVIPALCSWGILVRRTRGKTASEFHEQITSRLFPLKRLLGLYALIFLPIVILCAILFYFFLSTDRIEPGLIAFGIAAVLPGILLEWRISADYKKAYRQLFETSGQEVPRLWKGVPREEKREVTRRLAGVHGGAMVFLFILGLLISGGMKLTMNAFPWQVERAAAGLAQEEPQYVADLLDGKIKVPEKYIREQEQKEKKALEKAKN